MTWHGRNDKAGAGKREKKAVKGEGRRGSEGNRGGQERGTRGTTRKGQGGKGRVERDKGAEDVKQACCL